MGENHLAPDLGFASLERDPVASPPLLIRDRVTPMIDKPYLLVMTLPCYLEPEGRRYFLEELSSWFSLEHLVQIRDLTLASPLRHEFPAQKVLEADDSPYKGRSLPRPASKSLHAGLITSSPGSSFSLWKAIGKAGNRPRQRRRLADLVRLRSPSRLPNFEGSSCLTNVESGGWRIGFQLAPGVRAAGPGDRVRVTGQGDRQPLRYRHVRPRWLSRQHASPDPEASRPHRLSLVDRP